MDTTNYFISEFCQWANSVSFPKQSLSRLPRVLRRAVDEKITKDDEWREVAIRQLVDSENLHIEFSTNDLWVYESNEGFLEVGAVGPGWRRGWMQLDNDEVVVDIISSFFHFAGQYIHRSRAANVIGAIAASYTRPCDFRFGNLTLHNLNIKELSNLDQKSLSRSKITDSKNDSSSQYHQFRAWVKCINGLDPYIQRAVFQYWRGISLLSSNFEEEAITALDGLTSIAALFLQDRMSISGHTRDHLQSKLGLEEKDAKNLDLLYQLRCDFGAHPSRSKWWDFAEIYDEDIEELLQTSKTLLWKLCETEHIHRVVDPFPGTWSTWFKENAIMLFNIVWFKHIRGSV